MLEEDIGIRLGRRLKWDVGYEDFLIVRFDTLRIEELFIIVAARHFGSVDLYEASSGFGSLVRVRGGLVDTRIELAAAAACYELGGTQALNDFLVAHNGLLLAKDGLDRPVSP